MRAICVDDERLALGLAVSLCKGMPLLDQVEGFRRGAEALAWLERHGADIALLDIDMPDIDGIELAERIRAMSPDTAIVFVTAHPQYAVRAFELHASGYVLKPLSQARLAEEVEHALAARAGESRTRVQARTFGDFDLLLDGVPVAFTRSKAKELLAYLIDRRGSNVTRATAFAALFEDRAYDRPMQKYFDVIVRSLRRTLSDCGIEDILEMRGGNLRVCREKLDCDLYRFLDGDPRTVGSFNGEYMNSYSWGSMNEANLELARSGKL